MTPIKENIMNYCLAKPNATEDLPFDDRTWTAKIGGKIFLIMDLVEEKVSVNLKCDPKKALELRSEYPEHVLPGYHMNKKHWNTIVYDSDMVKYKDLLSWIDHSYQMVLKTLPKKNRNH